MKRVLLTSVCRPIGPAHGDAPSVGYELLHGQVTRAQGLFSPRSLHLQFSLEYVAENIDAPCVVLQYPSKRELIAELRKGYDYVCVSFLLAVFHRMKEVVALVREHAPDTKIVVGGYGTVLPDDFLNPHADHICREEGVGYMRRLLGEPAIPAGTTFKHPLITSQLRVFGAKVSRTGMIFAGLGCPNGCDFCCTSHFFKRKHIKLLPTGADIYRVVERYIENQSDSNPDISIVVLDEDFLLNKRRAREFREEVLRSGKTISLFVFASIKAISQYEIEEIVEMGIDGLWIGYEGTRSGYAKQQGRDPAELFPDLKRHGIRILTSMIVGLPYQDGPIVEEELDGLLALEPDLSQFLIYGPTPGTPFFDQVKQDGLLREDLLADPEAYYKACDGFSAMVKHPLLSQQEIEGQQQECFKQDFQRLGPTIYRTVDTWLAGHRTLRSSPNPALRRKAERLGRDIRKAYATFLPGRLFGPNRQVRQRIAKLQREVHATFGKPRLSERLASVLAVGAAIWTSITLRLGIFQDPKLIRHVYRLPEEAPQPARIWRRLTKAFDSLSVEQRPERTVWLRLEGMLHSEDAARVAERVRAALQCTRDHLVLDFERLKEFEAEAIASFVSALEEYRERIRVLTPHAIECPHAIRAFGAFSPYQGPGL